MSLYRNNPPQLSGDFYLTDAGLETDMVFNHGFDLPAFAAHTLLDHEKGREALSNYFDGFLSLATEANAGFVLDAAVWRAQRHFADELGVDGDDLKQVNEAAVAFAAELRAKNAQGQKPVVLNAAIGPKGDAYAPEQALTEREAQEYHIEQLRWLAATDIDMATALTFTQSAEAIGLVRAADAVGLPVAVSFTVETDGCLFSGQLLGEAIKEVDDKTDNAALYYMINCAHPSHFDTALDGGWTDRVRGLRCNASRLSHAELDACETLDDGNPVELATDYQKLLQKLPKVNVFGGCCGTDLRHVAAIAKAVS